MRVYCLLLSSLFTLSLAAQNPHSAFLKSFEGTIDLKFSIRLYLESDGTTVSGWYEYVYGKTPLHYKLKGDMADDGSFILNETNHKGQQTATLEGHVNDNFSLQGVRTDATGTKEMSFELNEVPPHADPNKWCGAWFRNQAFTPGTLLIGNITDTQFEFALRLRSGIKSGYMHDTARISGNFAACNHNLFGDCALQFERTAKGIVINSGESGAVCGFGTAVSADGDYTPTRQDPELNLAPIFNSERQHNNFKKLVDGYYDDFAINMQYIGQLISTDTYITHAVAGSVQGMMGAMEAIICWDDKGKFWAATINYNEDKQRNEVLFFSNAPNFKKGLPTTIETWRQDFTEYKLVYMID